MWGQVKTPDVKAKNFLVVSVLHNPHESKEERLQGRWEEKMDIFSVCFYYMPWFN